MKSEGDPPYRWDSASLFLCPGLNTDPKILVMDEATSMLTPKPRP